jgi:hypothetical protein
VSKRGEEREVDILSSRHENAVADPGPGGEDQAMALPIDTSKPYSRDQLLELVLAVRDTPTARETHWLEWKWKVDLREKRWCAEIAKYILGVSNRPRRIWEKAAEGWAYMLLGVKPEKALEHIELPDPADFDKTVNNYLGADHPHWQPIPIKDENGIQVVVLEIEPPRPGRRPYLARASFASQGAPLMDGRIYMRGEDSQTREASSAEVDEMIREQRDLAIAAGPAWRLRLECVESTVVMVDVSPGTVEAWLEVEHTALMADAPRRNDPLGGLMRGLDQRSPEKYIAEVEKFLTLASQRLTTEILWRFSHAGVSELGIIAHNDGDDGLVDLTVEVCLPAGANAVGYWGDLDSNERLPARPDPVGSIGGLSGLTRFTQSSVGRSGVHVQETDEGVWVTLPTVEVRPRNSSGLKTLTVFLPRTVRQEFLDLPWRATALGMRGVAKGTLSIRLAGEAALEDALSVERSYDDD